MEIEARLSALATKIEQQRDAIQTEEATKNAFIMPFIHQVLGYDVFNPLEVTPEFTADVGTKRGEKVDYAILKDGAIQILVECKKLGDTLNLNHAGQLFRYFSVTSARIAILTNGQVYQFYTDLDAPNKMDDKPFLVLDLLDIDDHAIPELVKITKPAFDLDSIINAAGELKYVSQIKRIIASQFSQPEDDLIKLLAARVYDGAITQKVREQFAGLVHKALRQFLNDQTNDRLKSALNAGGHVDTSIPSPAETEPTSELDTQEDKINTTLEELEGYNIVRAIVRSEVDVKRIAGRDTQSYFGILLDDNNRKPICRLHFNRAQKYLGTFDANKNETRHPINNVDDIFSFADTLRASVRGYEKPELPASPVLSPLPT
jgi:hypothetical protein